MPIKMSHLASLSVITNSLWIHASSRRTLFACWSSTFWSWSFTLPRLGGDPFRHRQSQHAVRGRHRCAGGCLARSICQERCEVSVLILSGHTLPHCLSNHKFAERWQDFEICVTVQCAPKVRHLRRDDFMEALHQLRKSPGSPVDSELQHMIQWLARVVVPASSEPLILLTRFEDALLIYTFDYC